MAHNDVLTLSMPLACASDTAGVRYSVVPPIYNDGSANAKWQLVGAVIVPSVTVSTHASNYRTYTVYGKDLTTAQATHTTNSSGGEALTAGTAKVLTLTGGDNALFLPGDEVYIGSAEAGTGPADDNLFVLTFKLLR